MISSRAIGEMRRAVEAVAGARIRRVDVQAFDAKADAENIAAGAPNEAPSGKWYTQVSIRLDDGRMLTFHAQETEVGEYGVGVAVAGDPEEASKARRDTAELLFHALTMYANWVETDNVHLSAIDVQTRGMRGVKALDANQHELVAKLRRLADRALRGDIR